MVKKEYKEMLEKLRGTNSRKEKIEIIKDSYTKQQLIKQILNFAYDPYKVYNLTSKNMTMKAGKVIATDRHFRTFLGKLLDLHDRTYTGNDALEFINGWVENFITTDAIEFLNILNRDIRCGVSVSTINKAIPNCVPVFKVALAKKYTETKEYSNKELPFPVTFVSRKLDGVRCVVIKESGKVKAYSRNGKEFLTLDRILREVESWNSDNFILDGEVCLVDENGNENFQGVMKQIRRKYHTIENPLYYIFDYQPLITFKRGYGIKGHKIDSLTCSGSCFVSEPPDFTYSSTYTLMIVSHPEFKRKYIRFLQQTKVETFGELREWFELANSEGWEGIMLTNGEAVYEGKRTKNLLKWKKMLDEEFEVKRAVEGAGKYKGKLGAIIVSYEGYEVNVGSGFTDEDREYYWDLYQQGILPQKATVQFQEKTKNKDGSKSLRFPVFKCFIEPDNDEGDLLLI